MVKQSHWLLLVLFVLSLCGVMLVFWYLPQSHQLVQKSTSLAMEHSVGNEPVTPIPLILPLDRHKVRLGQRLFHDPQLSHDNTISCAHCHNLATGGVDRLPHSIGVGNRQGKINTPTIFNSGFNFRQFWDGRVASLEEAIDSQLQHPDEMGSPWPEIIAKLENDAAYRHDFAVIYKKGIQPQSVTDAIATFVRSLTTPNSKFDRFLRGEKDVLNKDELAGYDLFKSYGCISCHQGLNLGGNMYEKLGLVEDYFAQRGNVQEIDFGRYNHTKDENDRYKFRVPSLRNIALTAPYLHDASVQTLEGSVIIMGKYELGVHFRDDEVNKIVKFLNTLTGEYQGSTGE